MSISGEGDTKVDWGSYGDGRMARRIKWSVMSVMLELEMVG